MRARAAGIGARQRDAAARPFRLALRASGGERNAAAVRARARPPAACGLASRLLRYSMSRRWRRERSSFGRRISSIPSLNSAFAFSLSIVAGSVTVRVNDPREIS